MGGLRITGWCVCSECCAYYARLERALAGGRRKAEWKPAPNDEGKCEFCESAAITELDGDPLCQRHADMWCKAEGGALAGIETGTAETVKQGSVPQG